MSLRCGLLSSPCSLLLSPAFPAEAYTDAYWSMQMNEPSIYTEVSNIYRIAENIGRVYNLQFSENLSNLVPSQFNINFDH